MTKFNKRDRVQWNAGQGKTTGVIEKIITKPTQVDGKSIDASPDDPRYLVKNDSTGNLTPHTADALQKLDSNPSPGEDQEQKDTIQEFRNVVNMTPKELEEWLQTEASQSVGQKEGNSESIGHQSGKRIIEILRKKQAEYTQDDLAHMKRVISYVHRHRAQPPSGEIKDTRWRYSLMNWGHDPLKTQ
jgi:hypothetical protein